MGNKEFTSVASFDSLERKEAELQRREQYLERRELDIETREQAVAKIGYALQLRADTIARRDADQERRQKVIDRRDGRSKARAAALAEEEVKLKSREVGATSMSKSHDAEVAILQQENDRLRSQLGSSCSTSVDGEDRHQRLQRGATRLRHAQVPKNTRIAQQQDVGRIHGPHGPSDERHEHGSSQRRVSQVRTDSRLGLRDTSADAARKAIYARLSASEQSKTDSSSTSSSISARKRTELVRKLASRDDNDVRIIELLAQIEAMKERQAQRESAQMKGCPACRHDVKPPPRKLERRVHGYIYAPGQRPGAGRRRVAPKALRI